MKYDKTTIVCICLAIACTLFAFVAPYLFTQESSCESLNFTIANKSAIGDTIGGLMSPFIGISGLILTFLAFYMQFQANKIQREEIDRSVKLHKKEEINTYLKNIQLINFDIKNFIADIEQRCQIIDEYCERLKQCPYAESALKKMPTLSIMRYRNIDRNVLVNAMSYYIKDEDIFSLVFNLYACLDFYSEGVIELYSSVYTEQIKNIHNKKNEVVFIIEQFEKAIEKVDCSSDIELIRAIRLCKRDMHEITSNGIIDFCLLASLLRGENYKSLFEKVKDDYDNLFSALLNTETMCMQMVKDLKKASADFKGALCYGKLKEYSKYFDNILNRKA